MDPVGSIIPWIATYGAASLAGATFIERLIPILPSYVLLVVIGMAAADGFFTLETAVVLSTIGSVLGCLAVYAVGAALGEVRSRALLERWARTVGISSARFGLWLERFRANQHTVALGAQLVPTVRLIAPGISGLLRAAFWRFLGATMLGATLWNAVFIGVGYAAALGNGDVNASVLALQTLLALVTAEGSLIVAWRLRAGRRARRDGVGAEHRAEGRGQGDRLTFLRAWLAHPLRVAAVAPSGKALARLITSEIMGTPSYVIEFGAGTGAFTRALVERGVPEDRLILVESDLALSELLARRFPSARILPIDAARLRNAELDLSSPAGAAVSGLPLLSMPARTVIAILEGAFDRMGRRGAFYQFTYGPRCPVARPILDRLGLKAVRIGGTWANLPPASVYRITRRRPRERDL